MPYTTSATGSSGRNRPSAMPAISIAVSSSTLNGLSRAFAIRARLNCEREYGRCIRRSAASEEAGDALVHRLDVLGVALVALAPGRAGKLVERLPGALRPGAVGDREHAHSRGGVALRRQLPGHLLGVVLRVGVLAVGEHHDGVDAVAVRQPA